jgi:hypothetical protein
MWHRSGDESSPVRGEAGGVLVAVEPDHLNNLVHFDGVLEDVSACFVRCTRSCAAIAGRRTSPPTSSDHTHRSRSR